MSRLAALLLVAALGTSCALDDGSAGATIERTDEELPTDPDSPSSAPTTASPDPTTSTTAPSTTTTIAPTTTTLPAPLPGVKLVFADDFEGERLDPEVWNTCHWWSTDGGCTIASNDELEWYRPENVDVVDGVLRLEARVEDIVNSDGETFSYTSGMVTTGPPEYQTAARRAFEYGYVEARLRVPAGTGLWSTFWLLPETSESRPEIDIMEILGHDTDRNRVHLHYVDADGERQSAGHEISGPDFAAGWHTFAIDWRPEELVWLIDGVPTHRLTGPDVPSEPLYIVLNLAVGGVYPGDPDDDTVFPTALEVDWVRVWEHAG